MNYFRLHLNRSRYGISFEKNNIREFPWRKIFMYYGFRHPYFVVNGFSAFYDDNPKLPFLLNFRYLLHLTIEKNIISSNLLSEYISRTLMSVFTVNFRWFLNFRKIWKSINQAKTLKLIINFNWKIVAINFYRTLCRLAISRIGPDIFSFPWSLTGVLKLLVSTITFWKVTSDVRFISYL